MCNKVSYDSKIEASTEAKAITKSNRWWGNNDGPKLRAYLCPTCENWHLTSMKKPAARNMLKK